MQVKYSVREFAERDRADVSARWITSFPSSCCRIGLHSFVSSLPKSTAPGMCLRRVGDYHRLTLARDSAFGSRSRHILSCSITSTFRHGGAEAEVPRAAHTRRHHGSWADRTSAGSDARARARAVAATAAGRQRLENFSTHHSRGHLCAWRSDRSKAYASRLILRRQAVFRAREKYKICRVRRDGERVFEDCRADAPSGDEAWALFKRSVLDADSSIAALAVGRTGHTSRIDPRRNRTVRQPLGVQRYSEAGRHGDADRGRRLLMLPRAYLRIRQEVTQIAMAKLYSSEIALRFAGSIHSWRYGYTRLSSRK